MKKSLLALAVLSSLSAVASAQTSVTLYGVADVGGAFFTKQNANGDKRVAIDSGHLSTSRWGIKGNEDIDSDLSARFNLESGVSFDTGTAGKGTPPHTLFDRRASVGISSKTFGNLDLGRIQNLEYDVLGPTDPSNFSYAGTSPNQQISGFDNAKLYSPSNCVTFNTCFGANGPGANESRQNNSIKYGSVDYSGFTFGAQHAAGEVVGQIKANVYDGLTVGYKDKNLLVGGVISKLRNAASQKLNSYAAGAKYTFDGDLSALSLKATYSRTTIINRKISVAGFGADYAVTPELVLTGAYYNIKQAGNFAGNSGEASQFVSIAKYALSKRTSAYATFTYASAKNNADLDRSLALLWSDPKGATNQDNATRTAIGIIHTF